MESNGSHAKDKRPDSDARSKDGTPTTSTTTTPPDNTNKSPKKRRKVNHGMPCHSFFLNSPNSSRFRRRRMRPPHGLILVARSYSLCILSSICKSSLLASFVRHSESIGSTSAYLRICRNARTPFPPLVYLPYGRLVFIFVYFLERQTATALVVNVTGDAPGSPLYPDVRISAPTRVCAWCWASQNAWLNN
ncbi:hypothetical protein F5Y05DRAFT_325128 [Hypoxylon sp. FL0543]|nr:hypothetical protein F5Y05DRAFT_325128 [Hypoxylon sp. FL0543]